MAYVDSNTAPKKVYLLEESDVEKGDVLICSFSSSLFFFVLLSTFCFDVVVQCVALQGRKGLIVLYIVC